MTLCKGDIWIPLFIYTQFKSPNNLHMQFPRPLNPPCKFTLKRKEVKL